MTEERRVRLLSQAQVTIDENGHIVGWNDAAEKLLGHLARNVMGRRCDEVLAGRDIFGNRFCVPRCSLMPAFHQGGRACDFLMDVRTAAGEVLRARIATRYVPEGKRGRVLVVHTFLSVKKLPAEAGTPPSSPA
jgi:PAS domain S-box-containing protein